MIVAGGFDADPDLDWCIGGGLDPCDDGIQTRPGQRDMSRWEYTTTGRIGRGDGSDVLADIDGDDDGG